MFRTDRLALLILLLAFGLRLIAIDARSLWYDEAFAVLFARQGPAAMLQGTLTPTAGGAADIHPLLYYLTLDGWMRLAGSSPLAVRLLSVLAGLLTLALLYRLSRRLFDQRLALAALLIAALAPFHVQYSQEARMYSLLALWLLGATLCFVQARRTGGYRGWLLGGLLAGLAMHTQQLAAFYLLPLGLLLLRRQTLRGLLLAVGAALLVYGPWMAALLAQWQTVSGQYWITRPDLAQMPLTAYFFMLGYYEIPTPWALTGLAAVTICVLLLVVQLMRARPTAMGPVLWLLLAPVVLMWLVSQLWPVFLVRALIGPALMFYVALAWLLVRGGLPRGLRALVTAACLLVVIIGLNVHYRSDSFPHSLFAAAADHIAAHQSAGEVVVHMNKLSALPMIYYGPGLDQHYLADAPGSPEDTLALPTQQAMGLLGDEDIAAAACDARGVWLVVFERAVAEYDRTGRPELEESLAWLDAHYDRNSLLAVGDLRLYHYTGQSQSAPCEAS